ncbi:Tol-Pal system beta propeller repeat protein TolB [Pseudomonas sp. S 311-6]|jgi:TolB protein|uniref:Tol-Pal system protein TolB n=2 Tax=Kerstersia gyiorum TaxID=206506 RepID=A0A4Q7ME61_9BURK|nr:Tol-Pal system beta propeller repeat protein TolB [Pseudomonas sp. S 311-6]MCP1633953.1 TolB protein [Kerstersia gyiorum]MCP1637387.1 TolB protein [Kerstersia gyiorum]MCP1671820.1 TolB protein [Kerstersia gyiorum]MCP1679847.1 TolB protein [Kerstersia gyiorum]
MTFPPLILAYRNRQNLLASWMQRLLGLLVLAAMFLALPTAHAQLRVDISGTGAQQYPIAIADFSDDPAGREISQVIRADLSRTGQFRLISTGAAQPRSGDEINFAEWRDRGADTLAYGTVTQAGGRYEVRYHLVDTVLASQLDAAVFSGTAQELRRIAHQIADRIYEKITGVRGVFSTRLAYVLKQGNTYELQIADADGQNPRVALRSREPIISPTWSPDGKKLAYVSFESGKPVVYSHTLATRERHAVANYKGSNSAPAWSPDGNQLAVVLTRDGLSQVYVVNADGSNLRRVTRSPLIDTEPVFAPDGQSLYFTSDRAGSPQIYQVNLDGSNTRRVTFNGNYNISPRVSPDGRRLLYISRREGGFRVAMLDLATGTETLLTNGSDDQSPSFSPNGQQVLYAAVNGGRGVLSAVSSDGRVRQTLSVLNGEVREPTWGPFPQ